MFMSGGAFGPEAQAFLVRERPVVYEKPLDLPLLSEHLRRLAAGEDIQSIRVAYGALAGEAAPHYSSVPPSSRSSHLPSVPGL